MTVVVTIVALLLGAAALMALIRIVLGPSMLDRMVATDVLLAILIAGIGTEAVYNGHATTLPIMVVLAILGFAGSVSVARFVSREEK